MNGPTGRERSTTWSGARGRGSSAGCLVKPRRTRIPNPYALSRPLQNEPVKTDPLGGYALGDHGPPGITPGGLDSIPRILDSGHWSPPEEMKDSRVVDPAVVGPSLGQDPRRRPPGPLPLDGDPSRSERKTDRPPPVAGGGSRNAGRPMRRRLVHRQDDEGCEGRGLGSAAPTKASRLQTSTISDGI